MPDVGIIPELCKILNITVNDLFSGEIVDVNEYMKRAEENILDMAKKDEQKNKELLTSMYIIVIISTIFYFIILLIMGFFISNKTVQTIIIIISTIIFLISIFIALKFEVDAGYYECEKCNHKFIPTYKEVFFSTHIGTTRHLKCPKCDNKTWAKKVLNK